VLWKRRWLKCEAKGKVRAETVPSFVFLIFTASTQTTAQVEALTRLFFVLSLSQFLALPAQAALDSGTCKPNSHVALVYKRHTAIDLEFSEANTSQTTDSARDSSVAAGGSVNITASGAGADSDITLQGTNIKAGNSVTLSAEDEIKLLATKNTADQHSSKSGSIGVNIGTNGVGFTVSASKGRGNADGSDVTWTNTQVNAAQQVILNSGGDTTALSIIRSNIGLLCRFLWQLHQQQHDGRQAGSASWLHSTQHWNGQCARGRIRQRR